MGLKSRYYWIALYKYTKGEFSYPAGYSYHSRFKGLIQTPNVSQTFNNGKDTANISGILFCDTTNQFDAKDIIVCSGIKYKITGTNSQIMGVSGIKPSRGKHAEYKLTYTQESLINEHKNKN